MAKEIESGQDVPPRAVEMKRKRQQPVVQILASPAYDLFLSLHVVFGSPPKDYEFSPDWIERARVACPADLIDTLTFFFGDGDGQWWAATLCGLLWRSPVPNDVVATLDWLAQMPVEEIWTVILGGDGLGDDWREVAQSIIRAQINPKPSRKNDQAAKIQAFSKRFRSVERDAVVRFLTNPEAERTRLLDAVHAWHDLAFIEIQPHVNVAITREAVRLEKRRVEVTIEELFTGVVRGVEYMMPAAIERLVLVPCLTIMPTIFHFTVEDTITYCYPISDIQQPAGDSDTMQRAEMVRLFDALADETRLRILRYLSQRQMYLTELSEHLKLTKATTRHHMIRLRAAGLVTLHMRDHLSYYSLRRETLDEPTKLLFRFLGPNTPTNS